VWRGEASLALEGLMSMLHEIEEAGQESRQVIVEAH
jgi:hypothetical protein